MFFLLNYLFAVAIAFGVGQVKQNTLLPFSIKLDKVVSNTFLTLDSNWRWIHNKNGYSNCYDNGWVSQYCPNETACSANCVIDGVPTSDWSSPYGVSVSGNSVRLNYVTQGPYSVNYGSRLYLMSANQASYQGFDLRGKEISFTVDVSNLPCGLNGAVYFVELPLKNPYSKSLTSSYGVNYGDSQCPSDIKYVSGRANFGKRGACSNEYDLWEANSKACSLALHPCSIQGVTNCTNEKNCGTGIYREVGYCDKSGADYNPNRYGLRTFFGNGKNFTIDSSKPIKVITQFPLNSNGQIKSVVRYYEQAGVRILGANLTESSIAAAHNAFGEKNRFGELGGFKTMTDSFKRKHVLVLSLWDDSAVQMRWLDSIYPIGSKKSSDYRGPCSGHNNSPGYLRSTYPKSYVIYSNFEVNTLK